MYTGVLDQNSIRDFFRPIVYPIGPPPKIYEYNQATIKIAPEVIINPQVRPLDVLTTDLYELHIRKIFEMMNARSNMQLADLNYKPHGGKSLQNLIDFANGVRFHPPPGSLHYQQLCLGQFYDPTHINCEQKYEN